MKRKGDPLRETLSWIWISFLNCDWCSEWKWSISQCEKSRVCLCSGWHQQAMTYKLAKGKSGHQAVRTYQDQGWHYFYYFSTGFFYSFETIHNIRIFEVEFSPCMANTMKNWNLSVQWWISTYVHRKLPFKNKNLR